MLEEHADVLDSVKKLRNSGPGSSLALGLANYAIKFLRSVDFSPVELKKYGRDLFKVFRRKIFLMNL